MYIPYEHDASASWYLSDQYGQPDSIVIVSWSVSARYISIGGLSASFAGTPAVRQPKAIRPYSIFKDSTVSSGLFSLRSDQYLTAQFVLNGEWVGKQPYNSPSSYILATWTGQTYLAIPGIASPEVPSPSVIIQQNIVASSFTSSDFGSPYTLRDYQYAPVIWLLNVSWVGKAEYRQASGTSDGLWTLPSEDSYIPLTGWLSSKLSDNTNFKKSLERVFPEGVATASHGLTSIRNTAAEIVVPSLQAYKSGAVTTYNLRKYLLHISRFQDSEYGYHYLQGGVKTLVARGYADSRHGAAIVINTTADQYIKPLSLPLSGVGQHNLSPRIIYLKGISQTKMGVGELRIPVIFPTGVEQTKHGASTVWFHTRSVLSTGFVSDKLGSYSVSDPTRRLRPASLSRASVFGDTRASNKSLRLIVAGIYQPSFGSWLQVYNTNRTVPATGFPSQRFGSSDIFNKSPSLAPTGIAAQNFSGQFIGHRLRRLRIDGFYRTKVGSPSLIKTPEILLVGLDAQRYGLHSATHGTRSIEVRGSSHFAPNRPVIWFRYRHLAPRTWQSDEFGYPGLTHGVRLISGSGFFVGSHGRGWVSYGVRNIIPVPIITAQLSSHMVGRHLSLSPDGFVATMFGSRIIPVSSTLQALGFSGAFGIATCGLAKRTLLPKVFSGAGSQSANRWGLPTAYNLIQHITHESKDDSGLAPPQWSYWTLVGNRNRKVGASGFSSLKQGYTRIENNARTAAAPGLEAFMSGNSMVAHSIRRLRAESVSPPFIGPWSAVYNSARALKAIGLASSSPGYHDIKNTRRQFNRIGNFDSMVFGSPFISYRVRTIDIERRYSISPPTIQLPIVSLWTRYIDGTGFGTRSHGSASLSIRFNIISPKWAHRDSQGSAFVKNLTPEVLARGRDSSEIGATSIRTQWREVNANGSIMTLLGLNRIADRRLFMRVRGWLSSTPSQSHGVIKMGSNPYALQYIWLHNESGTGLSYGIAPPAEQVPRPSLNQNVLYPNGIKSSNFGSGELWTNNLVIRSGIAIHNIGDGNKVYNKRAYIKGAGDIKTATYIGIPRLSPHTIWSVMEAPEQAVINHPGGSRHYVGNSDSGGVGARLGRPVVESSIRTVRARSFGDAPSGYFGRAQLTLRKQTVQPVSFRLSRVGIPSIPFSLIVVEVVEGASPPIIPRPSLNRGLVRNPIVSPAGVNSNSFGRQRLENFTRSLYAKGDDSVAMGGRKVNDTPFMWQGLRIGPHVPFVVGGLESALISSPSIWHTVRDVSPNGFNSFTSTYDLSAFNSRMVVRNTNRYSIEDRVINAQEFTMLSVGLPAVRLGQYFIRPDGNSEQFRKGAW